jgi:hypothetical protein
MFGAVIAQGRDYRETFQEFRPGFHLYAEREKRAAAGQPESFGEEDLYEGARPALRQLRADGLWLGIAGNQTVRAGGILRALFSDDVDLIGTFDDWGASKPDLEFFKRMADAMPFEVGEILCMSVTGATTTSGLRGRRVCTRRLCVAGRGPWAVGHHSVERHRGLGTADLPCRRAAGTERPSARVQRLSALSVVDQLRHNFMCTRFRPASGQTVRSRR